MGFDLPLFPEQASTMASRVDLLYFYLLSVSAFFTLAIWAVVLFYAVRYRRSKHPVPEQIEGSAKLEIAWTVIGISWMS